MCSDLLLASLIFFCQSCDKTWSILLLISQHPLRKRQSEDGAAGVTGWEDFSETIQGILVRLVTQVKLCSCNLAEATGSEN